MNLAARSSAKPQNCFPEISKKGRSIFLPKILRDSFLEAQKWSKNVFNTQDEDFYHLNLPSLALAGILTAYNA